MNPKEKSDLRNYFNRTTKRIVTKIERTFQGENDESALRLYREVGERAIQNGIFPEDNDYQINQTLATRLSREKRL